MPLSMEACLNYRDVCLVASRVNLVEGVEHIRLVEPVGVVLVLVEAALLDLAILEPDSIE